MVRTHFHFNHAICFILSSSCRASISVQEISYHVLHKNIPSLHFFLLSFSSLISRFFFLSYFIYSVLQLMFRNRFHYHCLHLFFLEGVQRSDVNNYDDVRQSIICSLEMLRDRPVREEVRWLNSIELSFFNSYWYYLIFNIEHNFLVKSILLIFLHVFLDWLRSCHSIYILLLHVRLSFIFYIFWDLNVETFKTASLDLSSHPYFSHIPRNLSFVFSLLLF